MDSLSKTISTVATMQGLSKSSITHPSMFQSLLYRLYNTEYEQIELTSGPVDKLGLNQYSILV